MKLIHRLKIGALAIVMSSQAVANVILDFESPIPNGLLAMSYYQGAHVEESSKVTDQYLSYGVVVSGAALVAGGVGHSASGTNSLVGFDSNGNIDYDMPVSFSFFQAGNSSVAGTTDYFSYRPDYGGGSGNIITISAYSLEDHLLGQAFFVESSTFYSPLSISGLGQFHRVTVDQTLYSRYDGGIMLDLVEFGDIAAQSTIPEPETYTMFLAALGVMGWMNRRRKHPATPFWLTKLPY